MINSNGEDSVSATTSLPPTTKAMKGDEDAVAAVEREGASKSDMAAGDEDDGKEATEAAAAGGNESGANRTAAAATLPSIACEKKERGGRKGTETGKEDTGSSPVVDAEENGLD